MEYDLLTILGHMGSPRVTWVLSGVRVARSLVFCVVFWGPLHCLSFMLFVCLLCVVLFLCIEIKF
jgi:hypothetical protein